MATKIRKVTGMSKPTAYNKSNTSQKDANGTSAETDNTKSIANTYICPRCGTHYTSLTAFPTSQSNIYIGWEHHIPMCKTCIEVLYNHYLNLYSSDKNRAVKRICEMFDIYYAPKIIETIIGSDTNKSLILEYIRKISLIQYKSKTYETYIVENLHSESDQDYEDSDTIYDSSETNNVTVSRAALKRWGAGIFDDTDYIILEDHYKKLKDNNPNADNNQEIFIKSLCHLNLLMTKALKKNDLDAYVKANSEYTKTFKTAGLKTIDEKDASNNETLGVTLATISQYTPEEFYKDKTLYEDWDEIGEYYERHIRRPIENLITGNDVRDSEFFVPETGGEDE